MFFSKQPAVMSTSVQPLVAPAPTRVLFDERANQYLEVAKKAGVAIHGAAWTLAFRQFLAQREMIEYPLDQVVKYMTKHVQRLGPRWSWQWTPLRTKDRDSKIVPDYSWERHPETWAAYGLFELKLQPYHLPVPEDALLKVATIQEHFPEATFYVSEIVDRPKGDPFLAVAADRTPLVVIHEWDEPGYYTHTQEDSK